MLNKSNINKHISTRPEKSRSLDAETMEELSYQRISDALIRSPEERKATRALIHREPSRYKYKCAALIDAENAISVMFCLILVVLEALRLRLEGAKSIENRHEFVKDLEKEEIEGIDRGKGQENLATVLGKREKRKEKELSPEKPGNFCFISRKHFGRINSELESQRFIYYRERSKERRERRDKYGRYYPASDTEDNAFYPGHITRKQNSCDSLTLSTVSVDSRKSSVSKKF